MFSNEKTLRRRQDARADWLEERWDEVRPDGHDTPGWLRQLALQLELWLGDELDEALYLEVSYDPVPDDAESTSGSYIPWNAFNSDTLYLRALTKSHFVAVDVMKASGQVAEATVSVELIPRSHLQSLQATDMTIRGSQPDTVRLTLTYPGKPEPYLVPHAEDYGNRDEWRTGDDLRVFRALRDDLRAEAVDTGTPHIEIH